MDTVQRYVKKFPEYHFHGVKVEDKMFYGKTVQEADGVHIYFNLCQPKIAQIHTLAHEVSHADLNLFTDQKSYQIYARTLKLERKAKRLARSYRFKLINDFLLNSKRVKAAYTVIVSSFVFVLVS